MLSKGILGKAVVLLAVLLALPVMAAGGPNAPAPYAWTPVLAGVDQLTSVVWDGSQFVAVGDNGAVFTSRDGSIWTRLSPDTVQPLTGVAMGEEKLVIVGAKGQFLTAKDGQEWSKGTVKPASDLSAVTYAPLSKKNGLFVTVGAQGSILTSKRGQEWKDTVPVTPSDLHAVTWGGAEGHELFVAVGNGGSILTSQDGKQWAEVKPVQQDLYGVAWGGERFVAVGQNGIVLVSSDGSEWAPAPSGATFALNAVAWCGSRFVAVGASGTILTSLDGLQWFPEPSPTATWLHGVAFSGSVIVAVGESGVVLFAPGTSISGKVVRTVTGVGVAGLTVNISGGYPSTTTASDGTYSFTGLASAVYTVDVPDTAAYRLYPHNRSVDITGGNAVNINFTAYPIHQVTGTVTFPVGTPTPYPAMTIWFEAISLPFLPVPIAMDINTGTYTTAPGGLPEGAWKLTPQVDTPGPGNYWVFNPQGLSINLTADATYNWAAIASVNILGLIGNTSPCTLDRVDIMAAAQDGSGTYTNNRIDVGAYTVTVPQNKTYNVTYTSANGLTPNYNFNPSPQTVNVGTTDVPLVLTVGTPYYAVIAHAEYMAPGPVWAPLAGATVSLKQFPGGTLTGTCTTGADGNCTINSATYGVTYTLEAVRSGYFFVNSTAWPSWTESLCVANDQTNNPACLLQAIPAFNISGRVTYAGTNSGIGGATVSVGGTVPDVTTAADGTYMLSDLPIGPYSVSVTKAGYTFSPDPAVVTIVDQSLTGVDFTGEGIYHVTGTVHYVTPSTCGTEIPSVTVTATVPGVGSFTYLTTGAPGEVYSIAVPPATGIVITAYRTGYTFLPSQYTVNVTNADVGGNNFTAYCPTVYSISGTVTHASVGLAGVLMTAGPGLTAVTNASGNYTIAGLAAGTYNVIPSLAGYVFTPPGAVVALPCSGTTNCSSGSATNVNFIATLTYSISGSVTATGAGATVTATMAGQSFVSTTAAGDGSYTIAGLIPGTWRITPTKTGYTFLGSSGNPYNDVTITNANVGGINFSCAAIPTYTIAGIVYDLSNNPVVGATLSAGGHTTTSVAGGAYTLTGLVAGTYTVTCTYTGLSFNSQTVTITSSNLTGIDFHAVVGHFISGTVYSGGVGYGGVTVTATQGGTPMGTTTTAANGAYSLGPFANGTYVITPSLGGHSYTPSSQSVVLSGSDRTGINFNEVFNISGRVTLGGVGLAGVEVSAGSKSATTSADGNYTITGLLPGTYTLTPSLADHTFTPATRSVTLSTSNVTGQDFTATAVPRFTIGGTVTSTAQSEAAGPLPNVIISGGSLGTATTGSDGTYQFKDVLAGTYTLTPALTGYTFDPTNRSVTVSSANVTGVNFSATPTGGGGPTVTTISPSSGPIAGGTSVTIAGTNFATGASLGVTFGGAAATNVTRVSATSITCVTPAHAAGVVDVVVTNGDGKTATKAGGFTYVAPASPTVSGLSPTSGPAVGGTSVTITGSNFSTTAEAGATVKFGDAQATSVTVNSSTSITAVSPAHVPGVVDVTVTTSAGTSLTGTQTKFTYLSAPAITSVSPTKGSTLGGDSMSIVGSGFVAGATVTIGGTAATGVQVLNATTIQCVTPAHAAGQVDVKVTNLDAQSATSTKAFTYITPPTISAIQKKSDPFRLIITGANFASGCTVKINDLPVPETQYVDSTKVKAKKGGTLKDMVPKGVTKYITVVNLDGIKSAAFPYTR